jgi:hypothetical protein
VLELRDLGDQYSSVVETGVEIHPRDLSSDLPVIRNFNLSS